MKRVIPYNKFIRPIEMCCLPSQKPNNTIVERKHGILHIKAFMLANRYILKILLLFCIRIFQQQEMYYIQENGLCNSSSWINTFFQGLLRVFYKTYPFPEQWILLHTSQNLFLSLLKSIFLLNLLHNKLLHSITTCLSILLLRIKDRHKLKNFIGSNYI